MNVKACFRSLTLLIAGLSSIAVGAAPDAATLPTIVRE